MAEPDFIPDNNDTLDFEPDFQPDAADSARAAWKGELAEHGSAGRFMRHALPVLKRMAPTAAGQAAAVMVPELRLGGLMTALLRGGASAAAGGGVAAVTGQDPARAAMEQGGATLAGEGLMRGARGMARGLMRSALRPTPTLQRSFSNVDIVGSALRERVPVGSQAGREGSLAIEGRVTASGNRLGRALDRADAAGFKATAADLSSSAIAKAEKELGRALTKKERTELIVSIRDEANRLLTDRRFGIAPSKKTTFTARETKQIKQAAQEEARSIIAAEGRGVNTGTNPKLSRAVSKGAFKAMPKAARPIEANTQRLIATQRALEGAEMRNPLPPQMTTWRGSLLRPLETPQFQSRLALSLDSPMARILALYGPRAATLAADEFFPYEDEGGSPR